MTVFGGQRYFPGNVTGPNRMRRKHHNERWAVPNGLADRRGPGCPARNVLLVHPDVQAPVPKVLDKAIYEVLVAPRIADEDLAHGPPPLVAADNPDALDVSCPVESAS